MTRRVLRHLYLQFIGILAGIRVLDFATKATAPGAWLYQAHQDASCTGELRDRSTRHGEDGRHQSRQIGTRELIEVVSTIALVLGLIGSIS